MKLFTSLTIFIFVYSCGSNLGGDSEVLNVGIPPHTFQQGVVQIPTNSIGKRKKHMVEGSVALGIRKDLFGLKFIKQKIFRMGVSGEFESWVDNPTPDESAYYKYKEVSYLKHSLRLSCTGTIGFHFKKGSKTGFFLEGTGGAVKAEQMNDLLFKYNTPYQISAIARALKVDHLTFKGAMSYCENFFERDDFKQRSTLIKDIPPTLKAYGYIFKGVNEASVTHDIRHLNLWCDYSKDDEPSNSYQVLSYTVADCIEAESAQNAKGEKGSCFSYTIDSTLNLDNQSEAIHKRHFENYYEQEARTTAISKRELKEMMNRHNKKTSQADWQGLCGYRP